MVCIGKATTFGAVSGAISFGIGEIATSAFSSGLSVGKAAFEAGLHGFSGGFMNALNGVDPRSGFASGAISSIVGSGITGLGSLGKQVKEVGIRGFGV